MGCEAVGPAIRPCPRVSSFQLSLALEGERPREPLMARRKYDINCVRLHFMDTWYINFMPQPTQAILADDTNTQRNLEPKQLEKLDYLIAAFKKRGIYVDMNLHVGRTLDERDGFENAKSLPWADKGIGQFEPRMIALQKEFACDPLKGYSERSVPSVTMSGARFPPRARSDFVCFLFALS